MKTIAQHNEERWDAHRELADRMKPHPNGLECPECGEELWDSTPNEMLTSNPPQKNIHCPACGYKGFAMW